MTRSKWSLPERDLVAELAVGIARRLFSVREGETFNYPEPGYIYHGATEEFKVGCGILWELGVAVAAYGPEEGRKALGPRDCAAEKCWPPYFKFLPAKEIRERILAGQPPCAPSLDEVISAYLGVVCDYRKPLLPDTREPFVPPQVYEQEIRALERLGYAEFRSGAVVWTDRIAPGMRASYLWDDDRED